MTTTFYPSILCNIPAFFYPTTVLLVDDDQGAINAVNTALIEHYKTVSFLDSDEAIAYLTDKTTSFFKEIPLNKTSDGVLNFRKKVYDDKRFQDVLISILDYEMPEKSGYDIFKHVALNDYVQNNWHSYILFTAKRYADFEEDLAEDAIGKNFISKFDPNYIKYLLEGINKLTTNIFSDVSHGTANRLTHDEHEKTSFLNDGNFLPILNSYIQEHEVCEGHLFDKQGSLMFLDKKAHLSWLIVRNETGIKNSIERAKQFGAPESVVKSLESKKMIFSLYETEDFESRNKIDWEKYLLKAQVFKDQGKQLEVFNHIPSDYYYAFTDIFPDHGIIQDKILSYEAFLNQ